MPARRISTLFILALFGPGLIVSCTQEPTDGLSVVADERSEIARMESLGEELAILDQGLKDPLEGSWRSYFPDPGSDFSSWRRRHADARGRAPSSVRLLAVGPVDERSLLDAKGWLEAFLGRQVFLGKTLEVPAELIDELGRLNAPRFLRESLPGERSEGRELIVAITDLDLWPGPGFDHVLGQSDPGVRTVIVSTERLGQVEIGRRRLLKILAHESAHAIGLDHEGLVACLMNGAASVEEVDDVPELLSSRSLPKLLWALELDASKRDQSLREIAVQLDLVATLAALDRRSAITGQGP